MERNGWLPNEGLLRILYVFFLGQMASIFISLMAFSSSLVATLGANTPLALSFFAYSTLAIIYGSILIYRRHKLVVPWYYYALLGLVDSQGSFLVNTAYQYTSITSVTTLYCWIIPCVIGLTWIFLGTKYYILQIFGAGVCIVGLGLVILSDSRVNGGGGSNPLFGDILVIGGTIFYAMSNVGQEFCVKQKDLVEVVSMISLFGMLVTGCEAAIDERKKLASIEWSAELVLAFAGYALSSFLYCTLTPIVLKMSGSTLFSLSLLTSDMWAVVIRVFFYKQKVNLIYYPAFALVVLGLFIYSKGEKNPDSSPASKDGSLNTSYQMLDDETLEIKLLV